MTINEIIVNARERIDAQLAVDNYSGYQQTLEDAVYQAYSLAMTEMSLEFSYALHKLNKRTTEEI
jgi:hypothetical protein